MAGPGDPSTGIGQIDFHNTFRHHPSWLMDRLHRPDPQTVLESTSLIDRLSRVPAAQKGLAARALRRCRPREPGSSSSRQAAIRERTCDVSSLRSPSAPNHWLSPRASRRHNYSRPANQQVQDCWPADASHRSSQPSAPISHISYECTSTLVWSTGESHNSNRPLLTV